MKALTKKSQPVTKPAKSPAKAQLKVVRTTEAQCCAKTSRTVAGCHD